MSSSFFEKRAADDLKAWEVWKADKSQATLTPLLKRFQPIIDSRIKAYRAPNTDEPAMRMHMKARALEALNTYDPKHAKGAQLATHVTNALKKGQRFNTRQQNLAAIPEALASHIGPVDRARDILTQRLGRDPLPAEVLSEVNADYTAQGVKRRVRLRDLGRLDKERRRDVTASTMASNAPTGYVPSREDAIMPLVGQELTGRDKAVQEQLLKNRAVAGAKGRAAAALRRSSSSIARSATNIADVIKKHR